MTDYRENRRIRCQFITVLWGDWHVGMFLDANLPTLLAAGNLPELVKFVDCSYFIHTTALDAERIESSPAYRQLCSVMKVKLKIATYSNVKNPIALHHDVWDDAVSRARRDRAFVLFMPPDVVWADGSFGNLGRVLAAGKRAIFMTYPRVNSETLVPSMLAKFGGEVDGAVAVSPADMMKLAIENLHPLMMAYLRGSPHFPIHPEMVAWPVAGDGILVRLLARELFCFEPGRYEKNEVSLLSTVPREVDMHVFNDSLEFLGLSLTPIWKDAEWYLEPGKVDPLRVGRWWLIYDSPFNDKIVRYDIMFRCGNVPLDRWKAIAAEADRFVDHLTFARGFVRVVEALEKRKSRSAGAFLAAALRVFGVARRWPHAGPFLIFAPSDGAFAASKFSRIPGDGLTRLQTLALLRAFTVEIRSDAPLPAPGDKVRTLAGTEFTMPGNVQIDACGPNHVVELPDGQAEAAFNRAAANLS